MDSLIRQYLSTCSLFFSHRTDSAADSAVALSRNFKNSNDEILVSTHGLCALLTRLLRVSMTVQNSCRLKQVDANRHPYPQLRVFAELRWQGSQCLRRCQASPQLGGHNLSLLLLLSTFLVTIVYCTLVTVLSHSHVKF